MNVRRPCLAHLRRTKLFSIESKPVKISAYLMGFVHELKSFVDNHLEEFPVRLQETRVLSDNVL